MALKRGNDPYYWTRPIQQVDAQRIAIGQRPQYTPEELTSMIGAGFQAQQEEANAQRSYALQAAASERQDKLVEMQEKAFEQDELKGKVSTSLQLGGLGAQLGGALGLGTTTIGGAGAGAGYSAITSALTMGGGPTLGAAGLLGGAGAAGATVGTSAAATGAAAGMTFSPIGAAIGLGIGALFALSDESVICTELNRQGYLPDDILALDTEYHYRYIQDDAYLGYRMWADTVVGWMKKSKIVTHIVKPFCRAWAYEMAHRMNPEIKGNVLGAIMCYVGVPTCQAIYRLKNRNAMEVCNG